MPRPRTSDDGDLRIERISVNVTAAELAEIDKRRGTRKRGAYLRDLVFPTTRANTEEREAAGAMIVFLSRRWDIPPYLPNNVIDTPAAARFLASVGLDARGRRKVNDE